MTTRPFLDTTPEDASISSWMNDVTKFVGDLVGDELIPAAPSQLSLEGKNNSVKISWRSVDEIGVSEYQVFRGDKKNFSESNAELVATVTQSVNPRQTITYNDPEAFEEKFYFVRAVKGLRRPKVLGSAVGYGTAVSGQSIGSSLSTVQGGQIPGFFGISGSILFVNDSKLIDQDNENLFYNADLKSIVIGPAGLSFGSQLVPDITLVRDEASVLAIKGSSSQSFRIYETDGQSLSGVSVTATSLTVGRSGTDTTVYSTASITPGANRLILAIVNGQRRNDLFNQVPICSGNGLTWVEVVTLPYDETGGQPGPQRMTIFRAMGGAPSSGAVTFTFPDENTRVSWTVLEFDNVDTGGANGANAVVQAVAGVEALTTTPVVTLGAFSSPSNATLGVTGWSFGPTAVAPGSGFTEISEIQINNEGFGIHTEFRVDNSITADSIIDDIVTTVIFGLEIGNVSQVAGSTYLDLNSLGTTGEAELMVNGSSVRDLVIGTSDPGGDLRLFQSGSERGRIGSAGLDLSTFNLFFGGSFGAEDTVLSRDGLADTLAQKRGSNNQTFRVYETDTTSALTARVLLSETINNPQASYTTSSIDPGVNKLILCFVHAQDFAVNQEVNVTSVSGAGLTWVLESEIQYNPIMFGDTRSVLACFRALGPSAFQGPLTILMSDTAFQTSWIFVEYDGVDTSGTNGSGAVRQSVADATDGAGGLTIPLAAFSDSANATVGVFGNAGSGSSVGWTEGSGFTKIAQGRFFDHFLMTEFKDEPDTTVDATLDSSQPMAAIGLEIVAADSISIRFIEITGLGASGDSEIMTANAGGTTNRGLVVGTRSEGTLRLFTDNVEAVRIGVSGVDVSSLLHSHTFLSGGSGTSADLHRLSGTLTGADGDTTSLFGMNLNPTIATQSATESIADIATLNIEEPNITDSLGGSDVITVASTLRIAGAPTEGVTNWALNIVSGAVNFGGGLDVTGVFTVTNNPTNQAKTQIRTALATVVTSSGSSVTASNLIPAGSFVVGITTRVTTLVTGPAGYDVGDGTDVDRWGNSILVAEDTTSDITDFQSSALTLFPAANDVVITSDGVDFTAGEILITVHYMTLVAPIA